MTDSPAANFPLITSSRKIGCDRSRGRVPVGALAVDRVEREDDPEQRPDDRDELPRARQLDLGVADLRGER